VTAQQNPIADLEDVLASMEIGRRAEAFRRVADLFASGATQFSGDQVALFDDIMSHLVAEIDRSARAAFGRRFASHFNAPPKTMRLLALDDAFEVAGPILLRSMQLDEGTLVEGARTKSQDHLFAISGRQRISQAVTDVLVERGDRRVAIGTAANLGAEFSEFGYSTLVARSRGDDGLGLCVWSRPEIPRQHLLRLFTEASEAVRAKFETADRRKGKLISDMVAQASHQLQTHVRENSPEYAAARSQVQALYESGDLSETWLRGFAHEGKFDQTAIALSLLSDLPIALVERAMVDDRSDQIIVLARAIGLSWDSTKAILLIQAGIKGSSTHELEQCLARFVKLKTETATKAIRFYRLRERATSAN
jgi:uncharacterized protein (DUF2336 family)